MVICLVVVCRCVCVGLESGGGEIERMGLVGGQWAAVVLHVGRDGRMGMIR